MRVLVLNGSHQGDTHLCAVHDMLPARTSKKKVAQSDLLILAFPLYVDSVPAPVISALKRNAADRKAKPELKRQKLLAIVNCGFPGAHHNETALAICCRFAVESNITWAGGLALGGGEAMNGKPSAKVGSMARAICRSLDCAANALAQGKALSQEAIDLTARPLVPTWMYTRIGALSFWLKVRKYKAHRRLRDRPYRRSAQPSR